MQPMQRMQPIQPTRKVQVQYRRAARRLCASLLLLSVVLAGAATAGRVLIAAPAPDPVIVYHALWLPHSEGLVPVHAPAPADVHRAQGALNLLIAGPPPGSGLMAIVPPGTSLLGLTVSEQGLATVDFSPEILVSGYGSTGEAMLLAAIVNTLTAEPDVDAVRILVAGQPVESLGGHIELPEQLTYILGAVYQRGLPDVTGHWAEGHITAFTLTGIISGYPEGDFRPERTVSREEFVKMLILARGLEPLTVAAPTFADVSLTRWSSGHIERAVAAGIILPADYGASFGPAVAPTRREIAVMLVRALGQEALATALVGTDLPYTDLAGQPLWATGYIGVVTQSGLMRGYPDDTFGPSLTLKRSEAVTVLSRLLGYGESRVLMVLPAAGASVGPQVLILGAASAFEATAQAQVNAPDGTHFAGTYVTATAGGPEWGIFAAQLPTPAAAGAAFSVETFEISAKDGSKIHQTLREVHRAP